VLAEHAFEYTAQIQSWSKVSIFEQRGACEHGPFGDHSSAPDRTAGQESAAAGAVIRAARTVDGSRAAELGDDENGALRP
jgi:hypothetical protein